MEDNPGGKRRSGRRADIKEVAAVKKFLSEFKEFALHGNVLQLAVGVIIGAAFQGVVKALTDNILSPIIGLFTGQNFDSLTLTIGPSNWNVTLQYGAFITALINFVITAFVIFLLVKAMNRLAGAGKKEAQESAPANKKCRF